MNKKKAIITGGTGYIGQNLVKLLNKRGWDVELIVRNSLNVKNYSLCEYNTKTHIYNGEISELIRIFKDSKPEYVFHLASLYITQHTPEDISGLIASNVLFGTQLLEAMRASDVKKIINTGTSWQHFESNAYNPVNLYAATKQAFEAVARYYVEAHGFILTNLKIYDTYGPRDNRGKIVNLLIDAALNNKTLNMSPGQQILNLVHVEDVVNAFLLAANEMSSRGVGTKNFAVRATEGIRLRDLATMIEILSMEKIEITWGGRPYREREVMIPCYEFDMVPNWTPTIELANGLMQLINEHRNL